MVKMFLMHPDKNQNMKKSFVGLLLLLSSSVFAQQTLTERFQKIGTVQEAQQFIDANQALKPALINLSTGKDSTAFEKRLMRQKKGDVFSVGYVTYKVLEATETIRFRANYIFLDGGSLSP